MRKAYSGGAMYKILILLVLSVALGCNHNGKSSDSSKYMEQVAIDKIINGIVRTSEELPQFVKIYTKFSEEQYGGCSGTVVGKTEILTAGHCVINAQQIIVKLGDSEDGRVIGVKTYHLGSGYTGESIVNDIALLETTEEIGLPLLPITSQKFQLGEPAMIVGFGLEDGEKGSFGVRRSGTVYMQEATPQHWVAQYDGSQSNPCFGDSGGPLIKIITDENGEMVGTALAGIVSAGTHPTCGMGDTTFYTRIDLFIESLLQLSPGIPVIN